MAIQQGAPWERPALVNAKQYETMERIQILMDAETAAGHFTEECRMRPHEIA